MKRLMLVFLAATLSLILYAHEQTQAQSRLSDTRVFTRMATIGNNFEIMSSELALAQR